MANEEKKSKAGKIHFYTDERFVPLVLLILSVLAFVPLISQLGFYWDDWPMAWFDVTQGPDGFLETFDSDRPFLAYLYKVVASVLGIQPLQWQILTVLMRFGVTLAFWWMVKQLWPKHPESTFWMAALLAVYPGFKQMPIAYLWANAFIMLLAYTLSYGMMLKAIENGADKKRYLLWTIPSVLLYTFCTISTEYYTGLDMIRPIIIWIFLLQQDNFNILSMKDRIIRTVKHWLPYLSVLAVFMFWRVFIFQFPSYQPVLISKLQSDPLRAIFDLAVRIIEDAYTATWGAWTEFFSFPNHVDFETTAGRLFWLFVVLGFIVSFVLLFCFRSQNGGENEKTEKNWLIALFILGLCAVVFPGFPYWVTSLSITLDYPKDRFLVAFMFGSCILMVGLLRLFIHDRNLSVLLVSLFLAMAIGGNILNANTYRRDWQNQREFVNQLKTRIPSLRAPTLLLTDSNPMVYETDNSLTGLVNLALAPESTSLALPYAVAFYDVRFDSDVEKLENMSVYYEGFRSATFGGTKNDILVYFYSPPGCLRIIDRHQHSKLPIFPNSFYEYKDYSNPSRISTEEKTDLFVQEEIFAQPIEQNWCYYFQKADLARQQEDWQTIADIGDIVLPKMSAGEASEYIIYIEAYAALQRWDDVYPLMEKMHQMDKNLDVFLCEKMRDLLFFNTPEDGEKVYEIADKMNNIGCVTFGDD